MDQVDLTPNFGLEKPRSTYATDENENLDRIDAHTHDGLSGATGSQFFTTPGLLTDPGDGSATSFTWEDGGGDTLLDFTDPEFPAVINAGVYAISVVAIPNGVDFVGKTFYASLTDGGFSALDSMPLDKVVELGGGVTVTIIVKLTAGGAFVAKIQSDVGEANGYSANGPITRLS